MKWKNSLTLKIWKNLSLFLIFMLSLLWILQVLLLNFYYEFSTKRSVYSVTKKVVEYYEDNEQTYLYDLLSYENNACIEIYIGNNLYYSSISRRGCIESKKGLDSVDYKSDFYLSNKNVKNYTIINPTLNNKTLVRAVKIEDGVYAFVNVSLEPIDSSIKIITEELVFITIIVLLSSFGIAYYISRRISKPIVNITKQANSLANGEFDKKFVSESDINEIVEVTETLDYARRELAKTDELRKDLMANVSHDLKTPLTMIKAYAEMAKDLNSNNKKKREENLNIIIEEADRLNVLVNDILDLSKNESKINELNITEVNITRLIKSVINKFKYLEEKEGYNFIFNTDKDIIVKVDEQKMTQVIYNLISNAINYTGEDKKVTIEIKEQKSFVRISVKDTGKGIDKDEIEFIWDKYYKNEKNHKRNKVGTGLGLAIVKSILVNHKFNYGVNSTKNKGTEFYFDIKM